jgi:hypothetical protein
VYYGVLLIEEIDLTSGLTGFAPSPAASLLPPLPPAPHPSHPSIYNPPSRPYDEELADGLQVLRYNISRAYIPYVQMVVPLYLCLPAFSITPHHTLLNIHKRPPPRQTPGLS